MLLELNLKVLRILDYIIKNISVGEAGGFKPPPKNMHLGVKVFFGSF